MKRRQVKTDPLTAGLLAAGKLLDVVGDAIPSDELRDKQFNIWANAKAQLAKNIGYLRKRRYINRVVRDIKKYNYSVDDFVKYIGEDTVFATLIKNRLKK